MLPGHKLPREEPCGSEGKLSCPPRSLWQWGLHPRGGGRGGRWSRAEKGGTGTCRVDVGLPRERHRGDSLDLCLPVPLQDVGLTSNERR